tara:strand:- start:2503 stop:2940 length:438 start_codon:yes stop_codon:yes gene_type:complete
MSNLIKLENLATMYLPTFSKKDAVLTGKKLVEDLFEAGELDELQVYSNIVRLKEVINSADKEFRDRLDLPNTTSYNGVEFAPKNGSEKLQYSEDLEVAELEEKLHNRKELVKLATKSKDTIYDSNGIEVTKVSSVFDKSSITVKF